MACEHSTPSALCQGCTWCAMRLGIEKGEAETIAKVTKWLRETPRAGGMIISIESSNDLARCADDIERGEWRKP